MFYTSESKREMEAIMNAFRGYIREHGKWDIIHSEKVGYIGIQIFKGKLESSLWLDTPKKMITYIFDQIISDVVYSPENSLKDHIGYKLTNYEKTESYRRILAILDTMEDKTRYLPLLKRGIRKYPTGLIY